jgi:hypothetical protein
MEKEQETKLNALYLQEQQDETRKVLDYLRKTRKSRGGTGAPLEIPPHLRDASEGAGIVITDADLQLGAVKPIDNDE